MQDDEEVTCVRFKVHPVWSSGLTFRSESISRMLSAQDNISARPGRKIRIALLTSSLPALPPPDPVLGAFSMICATVAAMSS